jgi:hypothetical protein
VLVIALHSASADEHCTRLLRERGFTLLPSPELLRVRRTTWKGDPDLLCIGPTYHDDGRIEGLFASGHFMRELPTH